MVAAPDQSGEPLILPYVEGLWLQAGREPPVPSLLIND
jgi:hypothetical protein